MRHGKPIDLAVRSTRNPKTKKYFGFSPSFVPCPTNYRKDLWDAVGVFPDTWDDVRIGGGKIKKEYGNPVWINMSSQRAFSRMDLRSILYSFGASIQDEEGNVVLNSKRTLEAVKFFKALYEEAMFKEVTIGVDIHCDVADEWIISGKVSLLRSGISVTRTAELAYPEMSRKIQLTKTPQGPVRRAGNYYIPAYFIWKFAENIEGARKFLIDYVNNFRDAFLAGKFRDFPCFPATVPDLKKLLVADSRAVPSTKYTILEDVLNWTTNTGYPGYNNAAISEIGSTNLIIDMFVNAATGYAKPEDAIKDAEVKCKRIFKGWREKGLI